MAIAGGLGNLLCRWLDRARGIVYINCTVTIRCVCYSNDMKAKYLIILQIVLLVLAAGAGLVLKGDLAGGPRMAHRLFGLLAGLVSLISTGVLVAHKAPRSQVVLAGLAFLASAVAGIAGKSLKTASNYSAAFTAMRFSAFVALILSFVLLAQLGKRSVTEKE